MGTAVIIQTHKNLEGIKQEKKKRNKALVAAIQSMYIKN